MKQVRETKAGKSISVYVILNPAGQHVATLQSHRSDSGVVTADLWHTQDSRSYKPGSYGPTQGRAGGYGYDKFTAAIRGFEIDGHKLTDHCGAGLEMPEGGFPRDYKAPPGYRLANLQPKTDTYRDCYRDSGLGYLTKIGYTVIQGV